ncbi:hypothetical protein HOP50_17g80730 [Chloropicon primus]|uniref:Transcription factor CBF/NF-Y/archaeal histone domain-containing protein n=1 Tax=Chloropicon primus TaxID=1764295 RepID=A0A5B8MYT4_9CHLO|nr:hypothetical protein A3770_17p80490 [Chloropicon primus]UPR04728.1 hypothetical protein HOP50_17g80730 [Chloropicon primus]|mmetsp:Transcript_11997/g.33202  ORF Transcript_11997/g.33202 Transcript_11997/m.33202 type:complete len:172 (-) Transcript_11997:263-778(-)|eukprot:QDZ25531.1 hypothetical protein A3770_17p80490 [Chloropicon primus]
MVGVAMALVSEVDATMAEKEDATVACDGRKGQEGAAGSGRRDPIALPRTRVQSIASEFTSTAPSADPLYAISRATELFLEHFVSKITQGERISALENGSVIHLQYEDLTTAVLEDKRLGSILSDVIPPKCHIDVAFPRAEQEGDPATPMDATTTTTEVEAVTKGQHHPSPA